MARTEKEIREKIRILKPQVKSAKEKLKAAKKLQQNLYFYLMNCPKTVETYTKEVADIRSALERMERDHDYSYLKGTFDKIGLYCLELENTVNNYNIRLKEMGNRLNLLDADIEVQKVYVDEINGNLLSLESELFQISSNSMTGMGYGY